METPTSHDRYARLLRVLVLLVAGLVVLCIVCLVILLAVHVSSDDHAPQIDTVQASANALPAPDSITLPETPDTGLSYQDSIIFVGDSLTAHLASRGVLSGGKDTRQVWVPENNMFNLNSESVNAKIVVRETGQKMTVAEAAAQYHPSVMIITLGTDWGVAYLNKTDFKACYTKLVKAIKAASPDTKIILQSIFPVTADCKVLTNEQIDTANGWVKDVAAETDCRYLDTQSILKGDDNCLKPAYCNSEDGIHLCTEAYVEILRYIRTHAYLE